MTHKTGKVKHLSWFGKFRIWWNTHHTFRKGVQVAFYTFVGALTHVALSSLEIQQSPEMTMAGAVIILRMVDNWAKHNIEAYGGEKATKNLEGR